MELLVVTKNFKVPPFFLSFLPAVQSLNSLNDQIASFMVSGPKALEQEEPAFLPTEKDTLQKSMTLMRRLLVDAQVMTPPSAVLTPRAVYVWL